MKKEKVLAAFKKLIIDQDEDALDLFDEFVYFSPSNSVPILSIYMSDDDKITIDIGD